MKKGLLTLLAASLVFVGCQNYDDQFDDLNAQISALKSQVDGLSSLSGQVSSLSGTISGLQSGIAAAQAAASSAASAAAAAGTEAAAATAAGNAAAAAATAAGDAATAAANAAATEAAAATAAANAATAAVDAIVPTDLSGLSASLAELAADVAEVQAKLATAATAEAVTALQAEIDAIEADLDDLLVSNNVYSTAVTINDAASMAAALALGNKVQLMNATVTITDSAVVADADIQTFVDRIKTMNASFIYSSGSATGFTPTFDKMVSAKAISLTPAGPVSFKALTSATTVTITTSYSTKITSLDMSALTSVTSFSTGTTHQLHLTSATNVDLGALPRYGSALNIRTKKGATLDIASLDDKGTTGLQADLALTLRGPATVNLSKITDGTISLQDVATATVSGFQGTLTVLSGVETLTTTDSVLMNLASATDLVTATLDFTYDTDPDLLTADAAIAAAGYSTSYLSDFPASASIGGTDLKTLTITGQLLDLYLDETNLETLSIDATMTDLTLAGNTDLTSLTISSDSKIGNVSLTGNTNLLVADFNHTSNMENKGSATANTYVTLTATGNTALTKLHSTGDKVRSFNVNNNAALANIDFTGLAGVGTSSTVAPSVYLYNNALVAPAANNTYDGETNRAAGLATDKGSFDVGTSGMNTLKTYLTAVDAVATSKAYVTFDTVDAVNDTEANDGTTTTTLNVTGDSSIDNSTNALLVSTVTQSAATVLHLVPSYVTSAGTASYSATKEKRGWKATAAGTLQFTVNGANLPATAYTMTGNGAVDAAAFATQANKDLFAAAGLTMNAYAKADSWQTVSLVDYPNDATTSVDERYTSATVSTASTTTGHVWSVGREDVFKLTITKGSTSNSVEASLSGYGIAGTALADIEQAIVEAYAAKYGDGGTASAAALATLVDNGDGIIRLDMLQTDSGGHGFTVGFTVTDKSTTTGSGVATQSSGNIGYVIGSTMLTTDNTTKATTTGGGLIITLETPNESSVVDTVLTGAAQYTTGMASAASLSEYTTTYTANTSWAAGNTYAGTQVERTDVLGGEDSVTGDSATSSTATAFTRLGWL
jgi:hypothetical protein